MAALLTREQFNAAVFGRDGGCCVVCKAPAVDAHHLVDRALWPDSGNYLDNGVSLCADDHMRAETTELPVERLRSLAGIGTVLLPPQFDPDERLDKWGNPILPNGQRMRGEMFERENVQKVLGRGGFLADFTSYVKYPKTFHTPWSPGLTKDDRRVDTMDMFAGRRVVGTVKYDGENTSLYADHYHARSIDGRHHPSRDYAKRLWAAMRHDIPEGWRVVCENAYARHSIAYDDLPSYLIGLSVWDYRNVCLSADETREWFDLLGVEPAEVVYDGIYDEAAVRAASMPTGHEGTVWRLADAFPFRDFRKSVAKVVREGHVQTDTHWMSGPVVPNGLRTGAGMKP